MKAFIVAAALALTSITATANTNAALKKVNVNITRAFENEFGKVQDVVWTTSGNKLIRANFSKDGEQLSAFFNESGDYVATTIIRSQNEIPARLKASLTKKDKNAVVLEVLQYEDNEDSYYFIRVSSNGVEKLYKGSGLGGLEQVKF